MATLTDTIELIFRGVDQASGAATSVGDSLKSLGDTADKITSPLADIAGSVAVAETALLALGGLIGTLAYKEAVDFEKSLLDLQKQMGEGEGSARDFAGALEALAVRYGTNANELVKSAADFKAGGYDIQTSTQLVKQSLDLMIAGDVSAAQATDIMKRSLAGFQIALPDAAKEAAHLAEVLNRVADVANSDFDQLAGAFADLAPIAKLTGLSFEEVAATLSVVIDRTGSGSEAANSLKSVFLSLVAPTKQAAEAMAEAGVIFGDSGKPLGSVRDILSSMIPAFAKMTDEQKLQTAAAIAGKEQASAFVSVLGDWTTAQDRVKIAMAGTGSTIDREVTTRLGSADNAINSTNEAFRQLLRVLGDEIRIETTGAIRGMGELAIAFKTVIDAGKLDPLFNLLRPQLAQIEQLFRNIAANLPAAFAGLNFDGLVASLQRLGIAAKGALEALLGPIDLNTLDGLQTALQRIIDLLAGLTNVSAGKLTGLTPFLEGIREMALTFKDAAPETQGLIGQLLGLSVGFQGVSGMVGDAALVFLAFGDKLKALPALLTSFGAELRMIGSLAAGGSIAAGLGAAGIAGAIGLLAFELTRLSGLDNVLNEVLAPDAVFGKGATLGTIIADLAESMGVLGDSAGQPIAPLSETARALDRQIAASQKSRTEINAWMDAQEAAAKIPADVTKELEKLTAAYAAAGYQYDAATGQIRAMADAEFQRNLQLSDSREAFLAAARDQTGYVGSIKDGVVTYTQWGNALSGAKAKVAELSDTQKKTAKDILETTKVANDFAVKMEQIASNERIKNIEAVVSIRTAQLEADADRVKAVFASIDNTVSSTGDILGNLFSAFGDAKSSWDKSKIESQIDLENKRRQEALDIQKQLAEAEIDRINAQTDALNRGDALIKIEGDALRPELEAFMWKILSLIRVRANAEFSQYLLGVAS